MFLATLWYICLASTLCADKCGAVHARGVRFLNECPNKEVLLRTYWGVDLLLVQTYNFYVFFRLTHKHTYSRHHLLKWIPYCKTVGHLALIKCPYVIHMYYMYIIYLCNWKKKENINYISVTYTSYKDSN